VQSGWLLRDGEVLSSTMRASGWHARLVTPHSFAADVGAVIVTGPALCWGVPVARLGESSRLRALHCTKRPRLIGPTRHGVALRSEVAALLRVGDELELRVTS
jgi:hypothetical protein